MSVDRGIDIEKLLSKANALRAAGDDRGAEAVCREALAVEGDHAGALEVLGDVLLARGDGKQATECFRRAFALRPERGVLEEKIGLAVLQSDEALRTALERDRLLENPDLQNKSTRNPGMAFLLSALLPGAGQMYNTDYVRGGILFSVSLASFGVVFYAFTSLLAEVGHLPPGQVIESLVQQSANWSVFYLLWVLANAFITFGTWTYAIIEAPIRAARINAERETGLGLA